MNTPYPPPGSVYRVALAVVVGVIVLGAILFIADPTSCLSVMRRGKHFIETTFPDPQEQP